jgi:hypothetical protein
MPRVPPPLSLRLGHAGAKALDDLARLRGITRAEAARQAIQETAVREKRRQDLGAEARRLAEDPGYAEEAREIVGMLEDLRGPW